MPIVQPAMAARAMSRPAAANVRTLEGAGELRRGEEEAGRLPPLVDGFAVDLLEECGDRVGRLTARGREAQTKAKTIYRAMHRRGGRRVGAHSSVAVIARGRRDSRLLTPETSGPL